MLENVLSPLWSIFNFKTLNEWFNFEWNIIIWFYLNIRPLYWSHFVRDFCTKFCVASNSHFTFIYNSVRVSLSSAVPLKMIRIIASSLSLQCIQAPNCIALWRYLLMVIPHRITKHWQYTQRNHFGNYENSLQSFWRKLQRNETIFI